LSELTELARDVDLDVGADSEELRRGITGACCCCLPLTKASEKALFCCQEVGGGSEALPEWVLLEPSDCDNLLPALSVEFIDDRRSGITATRMISGFEGTALEAKLYDFETSDPKLQRVWLLSRAFLCCRRCGESDVDWIECRFEAGNGELTERNDSSLLMWRNVVLLLGSGVLSITNASMVDVLEMFENRRVSSSGSG
jgi:hypothetical protein